MDEGRVSASERNLSIVIPVYNRAELVGRTLRSIVAQERIAEVDIIIVDNNSTDNSLEILENFAREQKAHGLKVKVVSETKPGATAARNAGLCEVATPYVMFFDSDDTMNAGLIKSVLEEIESGAGSDLIIWRIKIQLPDKTFRKSYFKPGVDLLYAHTMHSVLSTQRYAAKCDLIRRSGPWDENLPCWNDLEMGVRLLIEKPVVSYLESEEPPVTTWYSEKSITSENKDEAIGNRALALDQCEKAYRKAGSQAGVNWVNVRRAILAADYRKKGSKAAAKQLMSQALTGNDATTRTKIKALYLKQRLYPRGTGRLAYCLFSKK